MPDYRRRNCAQPPKGCGKHESEVGSISWSGLCLACGHKRKDDNLDDLDAHAGPFFQHWRRRIAASVGATLLDDTRASA